MVFSSLNFLFLFFPLVIFAHWLAPRRWKNPLLLAASIVFYAWGEPVYVGLMLLSVAYNYVAGLQIEGRRHPRRRRASLILAVAFNLAALGFFKYYGFLVESLNGLLHLRLTVRKLSLPIGISFYTFQALSYVIDVYRGKVRAQRSLVNFALYITMFPQLVAGPIVKYADIEAGLSERTVTPVQLGMGAERVILGLAKKVLLANNLGLLYEQIQLSAGRSVFSAWLGAAAYTLQIYFDFSGYSDMAIGMGRMLGFTFMENFDYPYLAASVTDFWRRWHISLSSWFRDYVYIPLGGNRVSRPRHILNLLLVWMLTGLWHGASWNFVLWGLYYGMLLALEKYVTGGWLRKRGRVVSHGCTLLLVAIGWIIFSNTDFSAMAGYLGSMLGFGASGLADRAFLYQARSNLVLLLIAIPCATPSVRALLNDWKGRAPIATACAYMALFLVSVAFLVQGTYNPFLYFRF